MLRSTKIVATLGPAPIFPNPVGLVANPALTVVVHLSPSFHAGNVR